MKELRAAHPLTQPQLAEFLLVTRNDILHYESGQRKLSSKARVKLARLEIALHKNDHTLTTAATLKLRELEANEATLLESSLEKLQVSLLAVNKKLKKATSKYNRDLQFLRAVPVLLRQLSPGKEGVFEKKWLQATEAGILEKLESYGPAKQKALVLRQALLLNEITDTHALIDAFNKAGKTVKKKAAAPKI